VTIAICIKINDGLIIAADSATTIIAQGAMGPTMALNVYNNANKVFNLRKGLPIGAVTWGAGSIGQSSISTIIKDLRQRFTGDEPNFQDWTIDRDRYTVEEVANRVKEFVYDELYRKAFSNTPPQLQPPLGFIVAGYAAGAPMADEFQIDIDNGVCNGPRRLRQRDELGVTWSGQGEPLNRLIVGSSAALGQILLEVGIPPANLQQALATIQQRLQAPIIMPAMPLQDAIDLADFLVDVTIKFSRFMPGAPTVGGPIEIAAISKHEGFRWVKRKYYFDRELNPEEKITREYEPTEYDPRTKVKKNTGATE
jgi:hypothetical protein